MFISSFQLNNYKSYYKSSTLSLKPGFNIITGQNNAGKTALLETLSLNFSNKPHISLKTRPTSISPHPSAISSADVSITLSKQELFSLLKNSQTPISLPLAASVPTFYSDDERNEWLIEFVTNTFSPEDFTFRFQSIANRGFNYNLYGNNILDSPKLLK